MKDKKKVDMTEKPETIVSMFPYGKGCKSGFIDTKGSIVIQPAYD